MYIYYLSSPLINTHRLTKRLDEIETIWMNAGLIMNNKAGDWSWLCSLTQVYECMHDTDWDIY